MVIGTTKKGKKWEEKARDQRKKTQLIGGKRERGKENPCSFPMHSEKKHLSSAIWT